jgi:NAD+ synthase
MARVIGVPDTVIQRPPSAGLWEGQTDEDEIGLTYEELDATLLAIASGNTENSNPVALEKVRSMVAGSQHKRAPVPAFRRG